MPVLSFVVLRHLRVYDYHKIKIESLDNLTDDIFTIMKQYCDYDADLDPLYMFDTRGYNKWAKEKKFRIEIAHELKKEGHYVVNRVNKYYVYAFSLDYTRFEVYSKGYEKKVIDWKEFDEDATNGPIRGRVQDDYNVNPVLKALAMVNN